MKSFAHFVMIMVCFVVTSCASSNGTKGEVAGNHGGSEPVNSNEATDYQKAVNSCHRTGGSRVVKIMGELRCY